MFPPSVPVPLPGPVQQGTGGLQRPTVVSPWIAVAVVAVAFAGGCDSGSQPTESSAAPRSAAAESSGAGSGAGAGESTRGEEAEFRFVEPPLNDSHVRDGWISLFDGATLFGWQVPDNANWRVEDGAIVADSGDVSLLRTPFHFDDFELRCEFHMADGGNSGVFLRTAAGSSNPATDTWELNICDDHPDGYNTGSLVTRTRVDDVGPVAGEWRQFRIRCEGAHIQVWLDDAPILDFTDESDHVRLTGQVGLQFNSGRIAFRNVLLRPLDFRSLFDGNSLTGWRDVPGTQSEFSVRDGAIHVENGPGFLETEDVFGDFILQIEARTNGDALNSGVFFRAQQGTEDAPSHGYEMQIQNAFQDGDRTQPADAGTGAIFRRTEARYVVPDDREWFTLVLIAQGDRFATWVDGYQVTNWRDTRDPDPNPRRGRRLEAGHLSLQGHDPTTDLDFRTIRIHPLTSPE